ncbi:DUF599 domain-containing protein [Maritimibacter sp. UBA3975]|uniref:DUF599 domain-containing protein n=1 Tax=Maritimibacter sp. UBA3975 TaxID=1946833 RepID=UPI000C0B7D3D|nr:DUF599 domain-containing protein [Maritimibacter sp. UBA3975]MAM63954.1 hypothetical protein [Maritimibacter sp.]|tara:strand:+ start:9085 stop:9780 length:696 start_codon:yes stop_codon:yes gene_type:complete
MPPFLAGFTLFDAVAFAVLIAGWQLIGWMIEHSSDKRPSTSRVMKQYRRDWLVQYVTRQPRIFDSSVLASLRQGTTFFASACMISIGGGLALLGNTDRLEGVATDLTAATAPEHVWEAKILVVILLVASGFLGFVWAHRLFGYCAVVMASVPNDPDDPAAYPRAAKAAEININAARSYNRGLRAIYFAMAALAWFLGPLALLISTVGTFVVLWRREFASKSRATLLTPDPE